MTVDVTPNKTWPVHEDYRIERAAPRGQEMSFLLEGGAEQRRYEPSGSVSLMTDFARLREGDERALVKFARNWGLLGWSELGPPGTAPSGEHREGGLSTALAEGDPLPWVWGHVKNVRLATRSYAYLRDGQQEELSDFLVARRQEGGGALQIARLGQLPPGITEFPSGDVSAVAEEVIAMVINWNMRDWLYEVRTGPLRLEPAASCPLMAIYWWLAQTVTTGQTMARCEECGSLYVSTDRRQRFCPPPEGRTQSRCAARQRKRRERASRRAAE